MNAIELVSRYAELTQSIADCKPKIADALERCPGFNGHRLEVGGPFKMPTDRSRNDVTHLSEWYAADRDDEGRLEFMEVTDVEAETCPHCYAAHLVIQERKGLRRQLGTVKGQMTKFGKLPRDPKTEHRQTMFDIGVAAKEVDRLRLAVKSAKSGYGLACEAWKDAEGHGYLTRPSAEWDAMLSATAVPYAVVKEIKRRLCNAERRLATACRRIA